MNWKHIARTALVDLLIAAVAFLPLFLLISAAEVKLRGAASMTEPFVYHASAAVVIYVSMLPSTLLGSLVHSCALLLIRSIDTPRLHRIAVIALSPLLPLTVILLALSGSLLLSSFAVSTAIATLAYGLLCSMQIDGATPWTRRAG